MFEGLGAFEEQKIVVVKLGLQVLEESCPTLPGTPKSPMIPGFEPGVDKLSGFVMTRFLMSQRS